MMYIAPVTYIKESSDGRGEVGKLSVGQSDRSFQRQHIVKMQT